jgi:cobalt/nickel transport system permease protein
VLLAVHIADGVLAWPWLAGGWLALAALVFLGSRGLRNEEAPTIALLSAAFFIASLIHVPLPGVKVHLLLSGLLGMILGWRAALAIPLGLALQALLFQHGGLIVLGANAVVMIVPALFARGLLLLGRRTGWLDRPARRLALGFSIGFLAVLATLVLHFITLALGAQDPENLRLLAQFDFLFHLPILGIESIITMVALDFLWRVKPGVLGIAAGSGAPSTDPVSPNSN